jgi:hypothetical protein
MDIADSGRRTHFTPKKPFAFGFGFRHEKAVPKSHLRNTRSSPGHVHHSHMLTFTPTGRLAFQLRHLQMRIFGSSIIEAVNR